MADAKVSAMTEIGRALLPTDLTYAGKDIGSGAYTRSQVPVSRYDARYGNPPVRFDVNPNTELLTPVDIDRTCIAYSINPAADAATFGWDEVGHVWV